MCQEAAVKLLFQHRKFEGYAVQAVDFTSNEVKYDIACKNAELCNYIINELKIIDNDEIGLERKCIGKSNHTRFDNKEPNHNDRI